MKRSRRSRCSLPPRHREPAACATGGRCRTVVPAGLAAKTLDAAAACDANEAGQRARVAEGVLGLDMYGIRDPLPKAGLRYVD